ncbi:hypothetical protein SKAU_G00092290 [Synaphobranchus kaupii]|uniref:Uncharacterized protein n=1 Tax=Synaphobranchus kaupii TaxID=118154 RepID=A0A9Q1FXU4_SYNKA|nr:hypothetical protein SKAU_G00092290 [Synaphobranchus kaupii]
MAKEDQLSCMLSGCPDPHLESFAVEGSYPAVSLPKQRALAHYSGALLKASLGTVDWHVRHFSQGLGWSRSCSIRCGRNAGSVGTRLRKEKEPLRARHIHYLQKDTRIQELD